MEFGIESDNIVSINTLTKHKDNNFIINFARARWYLNHNKTFKKNVKDVENGDTEHYKSPSCVPLFVIFRDFKKIGHVFPRVTKESKKKFLLIPKTTNNMYLGSKGVSKPYYIYDVDDDYIPKYKARLMFFQKSKLY